MNKNPDIPLYTACIDYKSQDPFCRDTEGCCQIIHFRTPNQLREVIKGHVFNLCIPDQPLKDALREMSNIITSFVVYKCLPPDDCVLKGSPPMLGEILKESACGKCRKGLKSVDMLKLEGAEISTDQQELRDINWIMQKLKELEPKELEPKSSSWINSILERIKKISFTHFY